MSHNFPLEGNSNSESDLSLAAQTIGSGRALAVDNDLVFALWGDGAKFSFRDEVARVKGSEANKPFGLTLPLNQFLEYVDYERLAPEVVDLFENSEELVLRSGALIFWRLPGRKTVPNELPQTVWSLDNEGLPVIQNWSPEGKPDVMKLLKHTSQLGVEFSAITSLNMTTEPEITDPQAAREFAEKHELALLVDSKAKRILSGSYPVIAADNEGLRILRGRSRAIGSLLLSRLLYGYPLTWRSDDIPPGWDSQELQNLHGAELRSGLLHVFGWDTLTAKT